MKFWKLALFLISYILYLIPPVVLAESEFTTSSNVNYKVQESGRTLVTHNITLENNLSTIYATTYTLSLENVDAQDIKASEEVKGKSEELKVETQKDGDKTNIKIVFTDAAVGKGVKRDFSISYENGNFAVRTGEVWEISIPRLSNPDSFGNYSVNLEIPDSFGLEAYISPRPMEFSNDGGYKKYKFNKESVTQTGITAGFGQFQVFSFSLAYHLENPLTSNTETQIALPPDTAFQKIYFTKLDPKPTNVMVDGDGNWIAIYKLSPRERIDVKAEGFVQIFASFRKFPGPTDVELSSNLKETEYWQVNDPQIKELAVGLKTPQAIYNYVSQTLKYDYTRVQPNVQRLGAKKALEKPTQAICMEFTDLFIALARAAGIPAREINGYAYTENPELQPLSLVADVLHSWPEYYDKENGVWIPIDPTWGSTTGGVDFFTKLDLRHFAFVIHGNSSVKPYPPGSYKLGTNPQKDVFVSFGKLPVGRISKSIITATLKRNVPFLDLIYLVSIFNLGPEALYSVRPAVYFDGKETLRDFIEVLTPFSKYQMEVKVPFSILGKDTPEVVKISVDGAEIEVPTNKNQVIINSLISIFILFGVLMIGILIKLRKITFRRLTATIRTVYAKFGRKVDKNTPKTGGV
ncbi:MAG: putative transglutaminase [Candidatus Woesebacteria bacterium GW2011_GWA2_40_7]|uniref:Putative transglutaminase n=3 Tax=Candidatus Woeseibacteriota TaxID=1752722 RepID=A0A0G0P0Q8_9BACT|nr:MAG: putative transglutaminase [Candidatus Woesebacteria bacterium GW2011_GWB1_39_10]KKR73451.1 MAG: putative transglutaminase [Candidatus Woesebacteria bacterium GW2011_GWA2_40_7]KKS90661.1 MAG: putative transglutaminase [Candidatus Woesebacteria bacterium GW2011_GWA1_43_12]